MKLFWAFLVLLTDSFACCNDDTRPNIILIITDDQDYTLGSQKAMPKTMEIVRNEGIQFTNAFVTSPMCCPSRSSILTGQYAHNHGAPSNIAGECYSAAWISGPEKRTMGTYLQRAGYQTIYIGKYLNQYRGYEIPPGWDIWEALASNSKYYNYTIVYHGPNQQNKVVWRRFRDKKDEYYPNVMTKSAFKYLEKSLRKKKRQPIFMVLSYPGPHGPEDSAPEYRKTFPGAKAPRTPAYNVTSQDKQWGIRSGTHLNETHSRYIDMLYRKRLQTLLSVDDHVQELYTRLWAMNMLSSTYIFFISDHGYHLGQWAQPKGKGNPYEDDIRVPFLAIGPRFPKGKNIRDIALNIDLTPTFLDIAGETIPSDIDGMSLLTLFPETKSEVKWRTSFLIERYKRNQRPRRVLNDLKEVEQSKRKTHETDEKERPSEETTPIQTSEELPVDCIKQEGRYKDKLAQVKRDYNRLVGGLSCQNKCPPMEKVNIEDYVSEECREKIATSPCNQKEKTCRVFDRNDWKTTPRWNESAFCFCYSSTNESFWCERRVEKNRNYLYCLFRSVFEEFYDLDKDPYQLTNLAYKESDDADDRLGSENRNVLRNRLEKHFDCRGHALCLEAGTSSQSDVQIKS